MEKGQAIIYDDWREDRDHYVGFFTIEREVAENESPVDMFMIQARARNGTPIGEAEVASEPVLQEIEGELVDSAEEALEILDRSIP